MGVPKHCSTVETGVFPDQYGTTKQYLPEYRTTLTILTRIWDYLISTHLYRQVYLQTNMGQPKRYLSDYGTNLSILTRIWDYLNSTYQNMGLPKQYVQKYGTT